MKEALKKNMDPRKFLYESGKTVEVQMSTAGTNMRYVRVFDLPPELKDDSLSLVLADYGKVERVIREKFPAELGLHHMYTGVRGVYMEVIKNIPPAIDVAGRKGSIFYDGLKDTCFLCQKAGHRKDLCPQRQIRKKSEEKSREKISFAAIVSGKEEVSAKVKSTVVAENAIIEVSEKEQATDTSDASQVQSDSCIGSEKEIRRKESMETLEEVANAIQEAMGNSTASQRRAHFAASRSGSSSGLGSRPKKKCARKTLY